MKALRPFFILSTIAAILCVGNVQAQIGIGTTEPNGILDLNSTDYGLVFPTVALTSTTSQSPVVNPAGGSLAVGTTVYNTAITSTGSNDVHTGLYSWTGSIWAPQFIKKEIIRFEQTGGSLRVEINRDPIRTRTIRRMFPVWISKPLPLLIRVRIVSKSRAILAVVKLPTSPMPMMGSRFVRRKDRSSFTWMARVS